MSTAVVAQGDATPILDPAEHALDVMTLLIELFAVATLFLRMVQVGKIGQIAADSRVIAHLPFGQEQAYWLAGVAADGMQLGVQAVFRAADTAGKRPFTYHSIITNDGEWHARRESSCLTVLRILRSALDSLGIILRFEANSLQQEAISQIWTGPVTTNFSHGEKNLDADFPFDAVRNGDLIHLRFSTEGTSGVV